jgi:hypothetical protein
LDLNSLDISLWRYEQTFDTLWAVPDLSPEEAEILRRSIAMLLPEAPSGLSRERALAILGQLVRALRELRLRKGQ